jgi:hypothetical protein
LSPTFAFGQNSGCVTRSVILNSSNQIEITYKIVCDSLKGFYNISESFDGKVKHVSSKNTIPFKFENNVLQISVPKLILNQEFVFYFKTFEQDVTIRGNCNFENYPNEILSHNFDTINYKLTKEPEVLVVVPEKVVIVEPIQPKETTNHNESIDIRFRVQIAASGGKMDIQRLKGLTGLSLDVYEDLIGGFYKYTIGNEPSFAKANDILKNMAVDNFKGPFIVAYSNGKRISVQQATAQIKAAE